MENKYQHWDEQSWSNATNNINNFIAQDKAMGLLQNISQETPEINLPGGLTHEQLFDIVSGSGAPMAIGSLAKGGKGLLGKLLKKLKKDPNASYEEWYQGLSKADK